LHASSQTDDSLMQHWNGPSNISSDDPQQLTTGCYPSRDILLIRDESIVCGLASTVRSNWRYERHNAENRPMVQRTSVAATWYIHCQDCLHVMSGRTKICLTSAAAELAARVISLTSLDTGRPKCYVRT